MNKFIQRHKIFLLILLALITLALGFFLANPSNKETQPEAGDYYFYFNFGAKWNNGNGGDKTGNYVSQDGNIYYGAVGWVNIEILKAQGGYWTGNYNADTMTGNTSCKFVVKVRFLDSRDFSCLVQPYISMKEGFSVSIDSKNYGSYGHWTWAKWDSDTGYFYATFSPTTYSINFNANGGVFSNGKNSTTVNTTYYENYNLPSQVPTRTGYKFIGWFTSSSGGKQVTDSTCFSSVSQRTLYAQWTANKYTIYFDNNGGEGIASAEVIYDQLCPQVSVPTKKGYSFLGYYSEDDVQYYNENGISNVRYNIPGNTTFFAKWKVNEYKVAINLNGGSVSDIQGWEENGNEVYKFINYDSRYGIFPALTKTGYTFSHYSLNNGKIDENSIVQTDSDHALLANWTEHSYAIKFNANGGKGSMQDMTGIKYSQSKPLNKNAFTRNGFLFKGWATSAGGEIVYLDCQEISKLTPINEGVVNLYAVWEETWANFAIKPNGNGTETSPYIIKSAENLAWIANNTNKENAFGGYFRQQANIDLAGRVWQPIGDFDSSFNGVYDGNNYIITNLTTSTTVGPDGNFLNSFVGLFGNVVQGKIKQVNIMTGEIYGNQNVGAIVGNATAESIISLCQSYITVNGHSRVGGIAGRASASIIENCYSKSEINSTASYIGGIVGESISTSILSCGFEGNLNYDKSGLIAGNTIAGSIKDCFANTEKENKFYYGNASVTDCLYAAGNKKAFYDGKYDNWFVSTALTPLPSGLSWLATAADKVENIQKLIELGYSKI